MWNFTMDGYYIVWSTNRVIDKVCKIRRCCHLPKLLCHSKIKKSTRFKVHIAIKYWNFTIFSNFQIGVETTLNKICFHFVGSSCKSIIFMAKIHIKNT